MSSAIPVTGLSASRPFSGLRPYRYEDHEFFFGREDQIYSLYGLFEHSHFIAVVGSSGSGKSSLVRAGLLPLLSKESDEPTGPTWRKVEFHPGDTPIGNLAKAIASELCPSDDPSIAASQRERIRFTLSRSSFGISDALREIVDLSKTSIVLVVDQFEELFRYAAKQQTIALADEAQRQEEARRFVQLLLAAGRDTALNVYILLTMRSDFIGDCANFRGLPEAVSATQFLVPSLTRDQREDAIRKPIEKAGAVIDPDLVQQLLIDSEDDLDQLPVLQHCLLRMWEQAGGRHLTLDHYREVGGMSGALSKHAEEIREALESTGLAVEQLFRSIAEIDAEGRIVRRARLYREIRAETGIAEHDLRKVVDRFRDDDCLFLTPPRFEELTDDTRIDIGHEALLRRWDRISGDPRTGATHIGWLRSEVADARAYRGLLMMAESKDTIRVDTVEERWKRWNERPRTPAWAERYGGRIEDVERLFAESLEALTTERERHRRQEEFEREKERRSIEELADRQRIKIEAAAARDREAAALRHVRLSRIATIAVSCLLAAAIVLAYLAYRQSREATAERNLSEQRREFAEQQKGIAEQQRRNAEEQRRIADQQRQIAEQQQRIATEGQQQAEANLLMSIDSITALLKQINGSFNAGQITATATTAFLRNAESLQEKLSTAVQAPAIKQGQATLAIAFSNVYSSLSDYQAALQSARKAQTLAAGLVDADSRNAINQELLFEANYSAGDAAASLLDAANSMKDYNAALAIAKQQAASDSSGYQWQQNIAFILNKIGDTYDALGQTSLVLPAYQQALGINQQLVKLRPQDDRLQRDLATSLTRVADAQAETDSSAATALTNYKSALEIRKFLSAKSSDDAALQSNLAAAYRKLAKQYVEQNDFADAEANYRAALQIGQSLAKRDPGNRTWQGNLAALYTAIGDMKMAQARATAKKSSYAEASENYASALSIREDLSAAQPTNGDWLKSLADSYAKLAGATLGQGDSINALKAYNAALSQRQKLSVQFPDNPVRQRELINDYLAVGGIYQQQNNPQDAAARYQAAMIVARNFQSAYPSNNALAKDVKRIADKLASVAPKGPQ